MTHVTEDVGDARPASAERGEIALLLAGTEMVLRPTYEAIEEIERITGKVLIELSRDAVDGRLTLGQTAQVATACIRAWGREVDDKGAARSDAKRVAVLILDSDDGLFGAQQEVARMLALAATGGYTSSGELKGTATSPTTSAVPAGD